MVRAAIVGCTHGELDDIYATVRHINEINEQSRNIDVILCCGDFECMRNRRDLEVKACPPKYKAMHDFYRYYTGKSIAPCLTIFIGGNHEASNFLQELYYGGWVAPNIFYLGASGVINVGGLRIAGISGIYKQHDYTAGVYEQMPFDNNTKRSIYHVRELQVFQLSHLSAIQERQTLPKPIDIFLSHDWPLGIENYGDIHKLLQEKPFFQPQIASNSLGSPPNELLLFQLQPAYWFAAHMHVKFAALVHHSTQLSQENEGKSIINVEEKTEDCSSTTNDSSNQVLQDDKNTSNNNTSKQTRFLSLDKVLPGRQFLQVLDITPISMTEENELPICVQYDYEWLAILRATHHLASKAKYRQRVPENELVIEEKDLKWVQDRVRERTPKGKRVGEWICDFQQTVPAYGEKMEEETWQNESILYAQGNPQTDHFLELLGLPHAVTTPYIPINYAGDAVNVAESQNKNETSLMNDSSHNVSVNVDPNEIEIGDDD